MAGRTVSWITWVVIPLALFGYLLYLALGLTDPFVAGPAAFTPDDAVWVLGQVLFAVVGAVVVARRPELPIGWLFGAGGLVGLLEGITARVAVHSLAGGWSPSGGTAAWLSAVLWYPNNGLLVLGALLFPSGRPPSPRWWRVAWLLGAGGVLAAVALVLLWPVRGLDLLGINPGSSRAPLGTVVMNMAGLLLTAAAVLTVIALLLRLRRARGVERQQLEWLTYAGTLAVIGLLLLMLPRAAGSRSPPGLVDLAGAVLTAGGGVHPPAPRRPAV